MAGLPLFAGESNTSRHQGKMWKFKRKQPLKKAVKQEDRNQLMHGYINASIKILNDWQYGGLPGGCWEGFCRADGCSWISDSQANETTMTEFICSRNRMK